MAKKQKKKERTIPIDEKPETETTAEETVDAKEEAEQAGETAETEPFPVNDTAENGGGDEKLKELNDRYLRLMAEYDNFRKRTVREKADIIRTATEELMKTLLPILDNLDRATEHKNDKQTYEDYVKGIAIIEDDLRARLLKAGLEYIEVLGEPFDPSIHEAVMQMPSDDYDSGCVMQEVEKGYALSGTVIRHPKVIVSTGPAESD